MDRKQELKDLKDAYKIVFNSPAGSKVLDDLADKTYFTKRMYDENPYTLYFREGRRDLYIYINTMLID